MVVNNDPPQDFQLGSCWLFPLMQEVWDATAADLWQLVFLKGYYNIVPVPRHWCQKRKFLQVIPVTLLTYKLGTNNQARVEQWE
jgi:splicing factor 3B subunit 2